MTGYTVHTGSTVKFSGGWDRIFSGKKGTAAGGAKAKPKTVKKAAAKAAKKGVKRTGKKPGRTK